LKNFQEGVGGSLNYFEEGYGGFLKIFKESLKDLYFFDPLKELSGLPATVVNWWEKTIPPSENPVPAKAKTPVFCGCH
jgi:hypothetical protein